MTFDLSTVGRPGPPHEFTIDAERTTQYAAATNDPIPAHRDGELAPPVFAVVPIWDANAEALASLVPPEVMLQVLHGEQDIHLYRPVRPGDVLTSRATILGVHVKPSGTTPVVRIDTDDANGDLVVRQYMVTFFRGMADGESAGETAPPHRLTDEMKAGAPVAETTQAIDEDQTHRYAVASGDLNPIHTDDDVARSVGLPGIINHGLCTMAFTSWAAVTELADADPVRLRRLAVRFSKPVLPGEKITTRFWALSASDAGVGADTAAYGFETTDPSGDVVVKDGRVEISS